MHGVFMLSLKQKAKKNAALREKTYYTNQVSLNKPDISQIRMENFRYISCMSAISRLLPFSVQEASKWSTQQTYQLLPPDTE